MESILILLVIFFALNMGASNFGAAFAAACGSRFLTIGRARLLFGLFVFIGAITVGANVTDTVGRKIIPEEFMTLETVIVIILASSISMFLSNKISVPQSTSLVTVFAIWGAGLRLGEINTLTLFVLIPCWIISPVISYLLTYALGKFFYPPKQKNFWIYEKLINHQGRLRMFVIIASCYNAFSVGTSNVANVAGPLAGSGLLLPAVALCLTAPLFGLGSLTFRGTLEVASKKIVPLGPFTATIVCFVSGSLVIAASAFGLPQPFVLVNMASIFAISSLKKGNRVVLADPLTKRMYYTWIIAPVFSLLVSYLLMSLLGLSGGTHA